MRLVSRARRFAQLCCEEPFRIFFPLGLLSGATGVLLWPLFFLGWIDTYPAIPHARLLVQGFLSCFIFGFLGTAGPRVMSVPSFSGNELLRVLLLVISAWPLHLSGHHAVADGLFLLGLSFFAISLARRFRQRRDSPPPNFALVGLGILNGLTGAALLFICEATNSSPNLQRLGSALLNVGFGLLPLLGVAPFFLRKLLDLESDDAPPTPHQRARIAAFALFCGLAIDASLAVPVFGTSSVIGWFAAVCATAWLFISMPMRGNSILAAALRLSLAALPPALGLVALLPAYRTSAWHILFIGGFSLAILSVATRVVLGHSGNLALVRRRLVFLLIALLLLVLAMISRFVADFTATRDQHLLWGAVCWLVAVGIWALVVLPSIVVTEKES